MSLDESGRLRLWVDAGGRCTLCNRLLPDEAPVGPELQLGSGQPLLVCTDCAAEVGGGRVADDVLVRWRDEHDREIRRLTAAGRDRRSAVLRVLDADGPPLPAAVAAAAVVRAGDGFPVFPFPVAVETELDLPADGQPAAVEAALRDRLLPIVTAEGVRQLSVFARAGMPALVLLGIGLPLAVEVFQYHRLTDSWDWPGAERPVEFSIGRLRRGEPDVADGVLVCNVAGTTRLAEVPPELAEAAVFDIRPDGSARHPDIIAGPPDLAAFAEIVTMFLSALAEAHPMVSRLHVFGELPSSAAVTFGRCLAATDPRPQVFVRGVPV